MEHAPPPSSGSAYGSYVHTSSPAVATAAARVGDLGAEHHLSSASSHQGYGPLPASHVQHGHMGHGKLSLGDLASRHPAPVNSRLASRGWGGEGRQGGSAGDSSFSSSTYSHHPHLHQAPSLRGAPRGGIRTLEEEGLYEENDVVSAILEQEEEAVGGVRRVDTRGKAKGPSGPGFDVPGKHGGGGGGRGQAWSGRRDQETKPLGTRVRE